MEQEGRGEGQATDIHTMGLISFSFYITKLCSIYTSLYAGYILQLKNRETCNKNDGIFFLLENYFKAVSNIEMSSKGNKKH